MVLASALSGGLARAADPDFTHVTDILGGQRHLLRTDDLFIAGVIEGSGGVVAAGAGSSDEEWNHRGGSAAILVDSPWRESHADHPQERALVLWRCR